MRGIGVRNFAEKTGMSPREGVINVWTQNNLLHDLVNVIITSRMGISEMANDNDNDVQTLVNIFY